MPSNAGDAAGLLNAAFESGRPTLFFYPKICLNDRETTTSSDVTEHLVPLGKARHLQQGDELTIVTWGSTVGVCQEATHELQQAGASVDLIDLRSISPWDEAAVIRSATRSGKLLVVHEDNRTCGFGSEVVATVSEQAGAPVKCRRVVRPDTLLPCNYDNQRELLPSLESVLAASAELLDLDLSWDSDAPLADDVISIEVNGSSPADQSATILDWKVAVGDRVEQGQELAEVDSDKAVFELTSPIEGVVEKILVETDQEVSVGTPVLHVRPARPIEVRKVEPAARRPRLARRRIDPPQTAVPAAHAAADSSDVRPGATLLCGLSRVYSALGGDRTTNEQLAAEVDERSAADVLRRTGIESRPRLAPGETALSMAVDAARRALDGENVSLADVDAVICSTITPQGATPSLACRVLHELDRDEIALGGEAREIPAFDVNAACTGYLYALRVAHDMLRAEPQSTVLVVTTDAMSDIVDPADFDTAILFGDAATATLVSGADSPLARWKVHRPVIAARGESGRLLGVDGAGNLRMEGRKIFAAAVAQMINILDTTCTAAGVDRDDLEWIVPHQANGRIIEAVRHRLGSNSERVFNNIRQLGNTSASSIPLALADLQDQPQLRSARPDRLRRRHHLRRGDSHAVRDCSGRTNWRPSR